MKILNNLISLDNIIDGDTRKLISNIQSNGGGNALVNIALSGDTLVLDKSVTFATSAQLNLKQDKLVSGTNIKTINGNNLLGNGNIEIQTGSSHIVDGAANGSLRKSTAKEESSTYSLGVGAIDFSKNGDASGENSAAFGEYCEATGEDSFAHGCGAVSDGDYTHAEGLNTQASDWWTHAEGCGTIASGEGTHAEGFLTRASGDYAHSEGYWTIASSEFQHAEGKCNIEDTDNIYATIVGNGTAWNARSNAYTLDWDGNGAYAGKVTVGSAPTNDMDVATKQYVDEHHDSTKQDVLVSGVNIKTINGETLLNSGDIITGNMLKTTYDTNNNGIVDNAEKVNNHIVEIDIPELSTTKTSVNIDVTNAAHLPLKSFSLEGNYYQKTLSGKNLLANTPTTALGVTGTLVDDGGIHLTGTTTSTYFEITQQTYRTFPIGSYTFSLKEALPFTVTLRFYDANNVRHDISIGAGSTSVTINLNVECTRAYVFATALVVGTTIDTIAYLMVESVSSKTDYEQYCGGIPSPNPQYPQDVVMVESYNELNSPIIQGGRLFTNGQPFSANNYVCNELPIKVKSGETYTISADGYTPYSQAGFVFFKDGVFVSSLATNSTTVVIPNNVNELYYDFAMGDSISINPNSFSNYMFKRGIELLPYLPYGCIGYRAVGKNIANIPNGSYTLNYYYKDIPTFIEIKEWMVGKAVSFSFDVTTSNITTTSDDMYANIGYSSTPTAMENDWKRVSYSKTPGTYHIVIENAIVTSAMVGKYIIVRFAGFGTQSSHTIKYSNVQIEFNSQATDFKVYEGKIVYIDLLGTKIAKLPDGTRDLLRYENRHLYIDKYVEKNISVSTESWDKNADSPDGNYISFYKLTGWQKNKVALCNYFECALWDNIQYSNGNYCWSASSSCGFRIHKDNLIGYSPSLTNAQKVQLFKNWLAEHQVETWYKLDEPQIIDLGEYDLHLYEGYNHIDILSSLDSNMGIEYYTENKFVETFATKSEIINFENNKIIVGSIEEKNLLNCVPTTAKGITGTLVDNGGINLRGTTLDTYFEMVSPTYRKFPIGTYTFSLKVPLPFTVTVRFLDANQVQHDWTIVSGKTSVTINLNVECVKVYAFATALTAGTTINSIAYMMLEEGPEATLYFPRKGINEEKYLADEIPIGVWFDGRTIYRKVIATGSLPNNTTKNLTTGLSLSTTEFISIRGCVKSSSAVLPLPFVDPLNLAAGIEFFINGSGNITIRTATNYTSYSGYIIIEYVKIS